MATLALSLAGQVVGGLVGGPFGATVGRALGALAGTAVDSALFGERPQPGPAPEFRLQGSVEGGPIPKLYGWSRLTGNIIWATELEELTAESAGAKGFGGETDETTIAASFAVAFCEGEVFRLGRIWADGEPFDAEGVTLRFYRGTEDQGVDSLVAAKQGGDVPAYRGLCYIVFERLPLTAFGNRIPNIAVELCRVVGELEPAIRAVTVIPGATEFGYDPAPRVRLVAPGVTANENTHQSRSLSDWTLSIDELTALCPNLTQVSLVIAWFGDDLRCAECTIAPRVESADRVVEGTNWSVAGLTRGTAATVSTHDGHRAYGGTPSDAAVLAAIADLKARGLEVTLYPMVMMDIPADNPMGQPAYPWRGRIGSDADGTSGVTADVAAFVGTGADWRFRRLALHYAGLAVAAGGVDAIVIGSEMRGMTFLRDDADAFPFVEALVDLAAEVRAIVGAETKITYAADWSEFSGLQPADAPGDKYFHLDPLWASDDIDAIGIDNYMPLTDWRDGTDHADAALFDGPYDPAYLDARIAGGEGYDWYFASDADRVAGERTPISDGLGEPWVWRFKDLAGWWGNEHHDRIGGVRSATPTNWVPESKPIWFTELGCAAVDKGANQPNIFGDAKSSEDGLPYFSNGAPDPLAQRQFLRAHLSHWADADQNPAGMVDSERIYLWTWDARPYPAFPADTATWADGENHARGHWLTGRLGAMASDEFFRAVADDYGVTLDAVDAVQPLVHGLTIEGVVAARDAMAQAVAATGLAVRDGPDGLSLAAAKPHLAMALDPDEAVDADDALVARRRADPSAAVGQVSLTYPDRERGYLAGTVTAIAFGGGAGAGQHIGLVLDAAGARVAAERALVAEAARDALEVSLPPSMAALEAGDVIDLGDGPYEIAEVRDGAARRVSARAVATATVAAVLSDRPNAMAEVPAARSIPLVEILHLPPEPATPDRSRLVLAAWASPWAGNVTLVDDATGVEVVAAARPANLGVLTEDFAPGQAVYWDDLNELTVELPSGHLASMDEAAVLAGANRVAVETDAGDWEVVGFAEAELVSAGVYRLTRLLRGQEGTDDVTGPASAGNRVVVLNDRVTEAAVPIEWLGEELPMHAFAGSTDPTGVAVTAGLDVSPVLPMSPVHLHATRAGGSSDVALSWVRRSRADGNAWGVADAPLEHAPEAYRVTILDAGLPVREADVASPDWTYSAAQQAVDFGSPPASFDFTVAQLSAVHGAGHAAEEAFDA